jgi:hypothetical protein
MKSIPGDTTGELLRHIAKRGADLTQPMKMGFGVAAPSKDAADKFALKARVLGFETIVVMGDVEPDDVQPDDESLEWVCICTKVLVPEYAEIVKIERQLDSIARGFGGYSIGIGALGNAEGG